ncbi:MAG: tRNA (adenosine(37)-N6)-dimethylallyltransferase MiaA [Caldilineaceae bacterium]|nr:tRNA (adenosine(37)-N6)-dimethylallyltransferase MiaA [Caldilineaceae bacterium]
MITAAPTSHPPLIVLTGPTAVGKTALSLALCRRFNGEVISADSRQIYRMMDIGTAKATAEEQAQVPHHLLDIRNPDETLTAAEYQELAYRTIDKIHQRGGLPFLVGGTALYLRAVTEGLRFPAVPPDPALRAELEAELAASGVDALFARLTRLDPATAAVIDGRNPRRVLRALEIFLLTGTPKVELEGAHPPPYSSLKIGLTRPRPVLYARIDRRVKEMAAAGLAEETRALLDAGYSPALPAMSSLGYREMIAYLAGDMTLPEAIERIQSETHRFVRHQSTSFRRMQDLHWIDTEEIDAEEEKTGQIVQRAAAMIHSHIQRKI